MSLTQKTSTPEIMTVPEVAFFLRLSPSQVYRLVRQGKIPHFRIGQSPRVRWNDLLQVIESGLVAVGRPQ